MPNLESIKRVMRKLEKDETPGVVDYQPTGRKEERYSYYLDGEMAFTFGITRSPKAKSKKFYYVSTQMGLTNKEYRDLDECTFFKKDLNEKLRGEPQ